MQEQIDTAHRTSEKVGVPIIILLIKKKKTEQTSSGNAESSKHNCLPVYRINGRKDSYHFNTSEEDELRNIYIFMNESLIDEIRKLLKLA